MQRPAATVSLAIHVIAAILLFTVTFPQFVPRAVPAAVHIFMPLTPPRALKKDGGGGQRQPLPATKGQAPKAVTARVFAPPMVAPIESPKLVVLALTESPEFNIAAPQIGDPLGRIGLPSGGPGGPVGIGNHGTGGIGDTNGARLGGSRPPISTPKLTREPQLIYKEEPEYSEEARKAQYQGTVVIDMEVDASGRPVNIRIVRGLGLGLDEKALEAVAHWRFRPAMSGDRPVAAPARAQLTFHLL